MAKKTTETDVPKVVLSLKEIKDNNINKIIEDRRKVVQESQTINK